jgi:hypothetical protein
MTRKTVVLVLVALLTLAGCSGGGKNDQPTTEPTVSTPADETSTPMGDDFATAVKFTKLVHHDEYSEAAQQVKPESPAARYVAHQAQMLRAEKIGGYPSEPFEGSFKPEPTSGSIRIKNVTGDGKAITYTWKDFTFDAGKITGWTGKRGPVGSVLWTRTTSDKSRGRKAVLKSAYLANSGFLNVVVELSSSRGTGWGDAEYAAKDGYRQTSSEGGAGDLSAGEKTLAYFSFEDSKFGGVLHIPYYGKDGSSFGDWDLTLKVK